MLWGQELWWSGAAVEPEAGPAPAGPCVCMCVSGCPHSPCEDRLGASWSPEGLAGKAGAEQGPASPWEIMMVNLRLLHCVCAAAVRRGTSFPSPQGRGEYVCVYVHVLCTRGTI